MRNISWCPCLKVRVNFLPQRNYAAHFTVDSLVLRQGKVDQAVARLWTGLEDILRAFIINVVASFRFTVSCETAKITTGLKPHQN